MRDMLFRGFHECGNGTQKAYYGGAWHTGEWVEGFLICDREAYGKPDFHAYIVNAEHPSGCFGSDIYIEVDPSTVGQYTGLTDKNGKKIFEGNRLIANDYCITSPYDGREFEVIFAESSFFIMPHGKPEESLLLFNECADYEVIGNIYDNAGGVERE